MVHFESIPVNFKKNQLESLLWLFGTLGQSNHWSVNPRHSFAIHLHQIILCTYQTT